MAVVRWVWLTVVLKMAEILLDPAIRLWVIIPIVLISLMFGLVRHYVSILLKTEKPVQLENLKDG